MVFKAELINTDVFKEAFGSISKIVDEVICEVDSEGFRVNALDRSHVAFVGLELEKTVFDEFICTVPEKICLDTDEFMRILKRIKKTDVLRLSIEDNDLIINLDGNVSRTFKIRLIDLDYESKIPPSLDLPSTVEVQSQLLKDCLGDMELFSDVLTFSIDEEYFSVYTNGEFGDSDFKYLHGEDGIVGTVKSNFSIPKLKDMLSASKFSDFCSVSVGNDMPTVVRFELSTGDGFLRFLLAPRLEADEE